MDIIYVILILFAAFVYGMGSTAFSVMATYEYYMRKENHLIDDKIPRWKFLLVIFLLGPMGWVVSFGMILIRKAIMWYLDE